MITVFGHDCLLRTVVDNFGPPKSEVVHQYSNIRITLE